MSDLTGKWKNKMREVHRVKDASYCPFCNRLCRGGWVITDDGNEVQCGLFFPMEEVCSIKELAWWAFYELAEKDHGGDRD